MGEANVTRIAMYLDRKTCAMLTSFGMAFSLFITFNVPIDSWKPKMMTNFRIYLDAKKMTSTPAAASDSVAREPVGAYVELSSPRVQRLLDADVDCDKPWTTFKNSGRLGNQICTLFHLYQRRYDNGVQVGLHPKAWKRIKVMYPHLHIKLLPDECLRKMESIKDKLEASKWKPVNNITVLPSPCGFAPLLPLRKVIISECRLSESIHKEASERLEGLVAQWRRKHSVGNASENASPTLVGIHVRRTDQKNYLKHKFNATLIAPSYFREALSRAREMFGVVAFMVMTDDPGWCKEHIISQNDDAVMQSKPASAEVDYAILTLCDHVIMTVGSYGTSAALLAGGKIFYPYRNFTRGRKPFGPQTVKSILDKYPDMVAVHYDSD